MQTIKTKYHGPTNKRGSRVKAQASGWESRSGMSLMLTWDNRLNSSQNHMAAAKALAEKLGWDGTWYEGGAPDGGSIWVNADPRECFTLTGADERAHGKAA